LPNIIKYAESYSLPIPKVLAISNSLMIPFAGKSTYNSFMSMTMALHHYSNLKKTYPKTGINRHLFKLVDRMFPAIISQNSSETLPHFIEDTVLLRRLDKVSGKIKPTLFIKI
jgi:hypothetical protein